MRRVRLRRGFSLLEVIVALTIAGVLLTSTMAVLQIILKDNRRARAVSEMMRDAEAVSHMLNSELRLAGLGVPRSTNISTSYGTSAPVGFYASLIVGTSTSVGIVADLPRPDSNHAAFGVLHNRPTGSSSTTAIAWHNESNGSCMPDGSATTCKVGNASTFFADGAVGCDATGTGASFDDRKCPWGMRRLLPGERIQIVAGDGRWSAAEVTGEVVKVSAPDVFAAKLSPGYNTTTWRNIAAGDGPAGIAGQGFVTTLDRVFYRLHGSTIVRRQCWGDPNPNDADWPNASTNAVPSDPTATSGGDATNTTCTPEEIVARNVSSLSFTYFNAAGGSVSVGSTTKDDVRRIDYTIEFARTVDGRAVLHRVSGVVRLTNIP